MRGTGRTRDRRPGAAAELPDTAGELHDAADARARRRRRSSSGPATTVPTRSPGTTGSWTPPATTPTPGSASCTSTRTTPSATRTTRSRRCGTGSRPRTGRSRTSTTQTRRPPAPGAPLTTPDVFVLDSDLRLRYRGAPDADHDDPSQEGGWLRAALDAVLAGERARAGRDRSRWAARSSGRNSSVTARRRLVRVPASSANLGPGFDVLAAALTAPPRARGLRGGRVLGRRRGRPGCRTTARTSACSAFERAALRPTGCGSRSAPRSPSPAAWARAPRRSSPA